jgi:hypothetical protein
VCPVGAVSKMITSNFVPSVSPDTKRENSSNDAISVVQAPERSSRIFFIFSSENKKLNNVVVCVRQVIKFSSACSWQQLFVLSV